MLKEIKGDIIATLNDAIKHPHYGKHFFMAQGCNCFIAQGKGLALQLRKFPEVFKADIYYGRKGDETKLGEFSIANIGNNATIFNCYTQFHWGNNSGHKPIDYNAIRTVFPKLLPLCGSNPLFIPLIGAGLAGGDWNRIASDINEVTKNHPVIAIHYDKNLIIDWARF